MALNLTETIPVEHWDTSISYAQTVLRQEELIQRNQEMLIFCEHPPTITLGSAAEANDLLLPQIYYQRQGITIHKSARGGKATYHGPGQLICYPILNLRERDITVHAYLRFLENLMSRVCLSFGLNAHEIKGKTGTWIDQKKIGFIGIRVKRGHSFHGCSLNVTPQHESFKLIVPCGMPQLHTTSLEEETGRTLNVWDLADTMKEEFFSLLA